MAPPRANPRKLHQRSTCSSDRKSARRLSPAFGPSPGHATRPEPPHPCASSRSPQANLPNCLDVPKRCLAALLDTSVDLFITEGNKKDDALASIGKCVVGITGVWNWRKGHELIPDWQPILPSLEGRRVFVVFDSDAASNPNVRLAEEDLAVRFLEHRGADAYVIGLPSGPNGEKQRVDDFLAANGAAAFNKLIAETVRTRRQRRQAAAVLQSERHYGPWHDTFTG